jgi:hypothetical protein
MIEDSTAVNYRRIQLTGTGWYTLIKNYQIKRHPLDTGHRGITIARHVDGGFATYAPQLRQDRRNPIRLVLN